MAFVKQTTPKSDLERHEELVTAWHARYLRERATAQATLDQRDFAMAEAVKHASIGIPTLSKWTGLTHQALYKAVRRGIAFKTPPLPF